MHRGTSDDNFLIVYCPNIYIYIYIYMYIYIYILGQYIYVYILNNFFLRMKIYSFNEASGDAVFNYDEMVLLILILIILILVIILMKMIQILLFLSDFWLVLINLKNAKNLKKR